MMFGRCVACLASFTAASVISAPELAKKNVSMSAGVISSSLAASGSARSCVKTLIWAWMKRSAWAAIAAATSGGRGRWS